MTEYTNKNGETDYYDENAVKDVEITAAQYIAIHRALPSQIGVDARQYAEVKKAERAGRAPKVQFKGKEITLTVVRADNFGHTRARINLNNGTRLCETVSGR